MQESRLFKIVYHLSNKGQATAPKPAKKLDVSVRTIYRDIETLIEAGIPVYAETGRSGGIHLISDFVLEKAMLSEKEKKELLAALQNLTVTGDTYSERINPDIGCQVFFDIMIVREQIGRSLLC